MTNPNNAIGTNAAYGTRTSVNAFNDICQIVSGRGVLSGFSVVPKAGMTVSVGGVAGYRDVAIAEDNLGNRTSVNNRTSSAVDVTLGASSASSARYDAIVVYVNNPAQASNLTPDAPSVCGIIAAQGGSSGVTDAQIRSAITADGGTGSIAYYAVIAQIYVAANASAITSSNISMRHVSISAADIADNEIITRMIANGAITSAKIASGVVPTRTLLFNNGTSSTVTSSLSQAPSNFQYLLVELIDNDGNRFDRLVPAGNTYFTAVSHGYANNRIYAKWCKWQVSGSTITRTYALVTSGTFENPVTESSNIGINRVYGIKIQ